MSTSETYGTGIFGHSLFDACDDRLSFAEAASMIHSFRAALSVGVISNSDSQCKALISSLYRSVVEGDVRPL
ncbi:hypothetical protein ACVC7O_03790 [Roseobacter sp. A03A-229]